MSVSPIGGQNMILAAQAAAAAAKPEAAEPAGVPDHDGDNDSAVKVTLSKSS
ncbi:hypothetical protein [Conexibacter sp. DBS9H8]|uniref:hypothetical protein n=1 Tax=Conexibacter sp. DBS9H8 TaxID=2937801 RepID=UPI00200BCA23|nr:hypothetical protein [Conexibacter sp. DBS9H8]